MDDQQLMDELRQMDDSQMIDELRQEVYYARELGAKTEREAIIKFINRMAQLYSDDAPVMVSLADWINSEAHLKSGII